MLTRKQSSFGKVVKGSFFSLGQTKSWTNVNCRLLHMFRSSASILSFCATDASLNTARMSRLDTSSCSSAVLQSGSLERGEGLGAGVGGDAGADGRLLWGIVEAIGLLDMRIERSLERVSMLLLLGWRVEDCGRPCMLTGELASSSSESNIETGRPSWVSSSKMSSSIIGREPVFRNGDEIIR